MNFSKEQNDHEVQNKFSDHGLLTVTVTGKSNVRDNYERKTLVNMDKGEVQSKRHCTNKRTKMVGDGEDT